MWLDRSLIKQQAKGLIKNRVLKLFAITVIVVLITNVGSVIYNVSSYENVFDSKNYNDYGDFGGYEDYFNDNFGDGSNSRADEFNNFDNSGNSEYEDNFNNFGSESGSQNFEDNFNNFGTDFYGGSFDNNGQITLSAGAQEPVNGGMGMSSLVSAVSFAGFIIMIFISPLTVALSYFYVEYVTGRDFDIDTGLKSVFNNAFKVTYLKKVGVWFLRGIITALLMILLIFPGVIFFYSSYFSFELMSEYPELSPWQAIKLSKKIVKGNRTELFALDLSFIPWILLCIFIFPIIYVWPYICTTKALYYENFKMRALAMHIITEDDFLSDAQRMEKAMNAGAQYNSTYGNNYSQYQQGTQYQQNTQNQQNTQYQQNAQYQQGTQYQQNAQYQQGTQYQQYNQPQGGYYQPQSGAPYYQNPPYQPGNYAQPYGNVVRNVYFTPVMPAQRAEQPTGAADEIYRTVNNAQAQNTPGENSAQPQAENKTAQGTQAAQTTQPEAPEITITPPQEPTEPDFAEPQEPTENFTEPSDSQEPTDFNDTQEPKNEN